MIFAFYAFALVAVFGATLAVQLTNLVRAVFGLLLFFGALAGLFLLLMAEFIAAAQILVYVGAVGILMLFAIMLTHRVTGDDDRNGFSHGWFWGSLLAAITFAALLLPALDQADLGSWQEADMVPTTKLLGERLMDPYTLTLEVTALLLTAALLGAIAVAKGNSKGREDKEN